MRCIAIVPAYNEQGAIGAVVAELLAFDPTYNVLVVDDASTDGTAARARAHQIHCMKLHPGIVGVPGRDPRVAVRLDLSRGSPFNFGEDARAVRRDLIFLIEPANEFGLHFGAGIAICAASRYEKSDRNQNPAGDQSENEIKCGSH